MIKHTKKLITLTLVASMVLTTGIYSFAADNDGWTEAKTTSAAANNGWEKWCAEWKIAKNNPVQISLTPGRNESELNFAWYSRKDESIPGLRFGKTTNLTDSDNITVSHEDAVKGFISNKATAKNIESGATYYYSYQVDGKWLSPMKYTAKNNSDGFSFIFVGDPQIGSSSENIATGETKEQGQDNATRNDSFNWNNTIKKALQKQPNASFMLSAGDQIQSRDKKNPSKTYDKNEIEYSGYLSPGLLKTLPVATTIGNHDAPSGNYSFHFDNNIDVVLTGHDHTYSRSFILKSGSKNESSFITEDEFDAYIDGETPIDSKYNQYLTSIEDASAVTDKSLKIILFCIFIFLQPNRQSSAYKQTEYQF